MATALVSALTNIPVRKDVAMTGEITLRGTVLPVGGIKDKILAAFRADITEIAIPRDNEKDLDDIPEEIRDVLTIHLVEQMDEVLTFALDGEIRSLPESKEKYQSSSDSVDPGSVAH
ncbi:MAG: endopeptidase La, partial [Holophagales bacterium]|nr:endopeptidase La [Holophagales bacterium]